jgi:hypothetical protein
MRCPAGKLRKANCIDCQCVEKFCLSCGVPRVLGDFELNDKNLRKATCIICPDSLTYFIEHDDKGFEEINMLKPCNKCNHVGIALIQINGVTGWVAQCTTCTSKTREAITQKEAVDNWNLQHPLKLEKEN